MSSDCFVKYCNAKVNMIYHPLKSKNDNRRDDFRRFSLLLIIQTKLVTKRRIRNRTYSNQKKKIRNTFSDDDRDRCGEKCSKHLSTVLPSKTHSSRVCPSSNLFRRYTVYTPNFPPLILFVSRIRETYCTHTHSHIYTAVLGNFRWQNVKSLLTGTELLYFALSFCSEAPSIVLRPHHASDPPHPFHLNRYRENKRKLFGKLCSHRLVFPNQKVRKIGIVF